MNPIPAAATPAREALWTRNFILIFLVNFLIFSGFQMFPAALPLYLNNLGADNAVLGWMVGIANLFTVLVRPFTGAALDRYGRKWVFVIGLFIMMLASAAHYIPIVLALFLVRAVHGVGFGIANTGSNTVATDNLPRTRFAEGMGYFSLSGSLALAISPALALSMSSGAMIGTATGFSLLALVLAFALKYGKAPVTATAAENSPGPSEPAAAPAKAKKNGRPKLALYEKSALLPAFVLFCITSTYGALVTFLALYARERGIENIGIYFTVYALVLFLTRPAVGKFLDKRGYGAAILPGLVALLIALLILSLADSLPLFLISAAFFGLGQGSVQTSAQTMAVAEAPKEKIGLANATYFVGYDAGVGFGAVVAGLLAQAVGYSSMFMLNMLLPVIAAGLYIHGSRARKRARQSAEAAILAAEKTETK